MWEIEFEIVECQRVQVLILVCVEVSVGDGTKKMIENADIES